MTAPGFHTDIGTTVEVPGTRHIRISGHVTLDEAPELRRAILRENARRLLGLA